MFRMSVKKVLGQEYSIVIPHMKSRVINHTKFPEAMKKDADILLFQRSVELYHLKYTLYVRDVNESKVVSETMVKTHGDSYCIEKQNCIP